MEPTGKAEEREVKEQLATVNGWGDEGGRLQLQATFGEPVTRQRERWKDFLKYLYPHGVKGFKSSRFRVRGVYYFWYLKGERLFLF